MNFIDDQLFEPRLEGGRHPEVDHLGASAVAAFPDQPFRRDVAAEVVRIGIDPDTVSIELALETVRVVNADLAGQEEHGEVVAEGERLNRVADRGHELLSAIQPGEVPLGAVAGGAALPCGFRQLFARRGLGEG